MMHVAILKNTCLYNILRFAYNSENLGKMEFTYRKEEENDANLPLYEKKIESIRFTFFVEC